MEIFVLKTSRLRRCEKKFIADHLTRPNSDFQTALLNDTPKGMIAICLDQGEIIGWARTEMWQGMPTLEAFVSPAYRRRGVAKACAAALDAGGVYRDHDFIAVFSRSVASMAKGLGLRFSRFDLKPDGTWKEAPA